MAPLTALMSLFSFSSCTTYSALFASSSSRVSVAIVSLSLSAALFGRAADNYWFLVSRPSLIQLNPASRVVYQNFEVSGRSSRLCGRIVMPNASQSASKVKGRVIVHAARLNLVLLDTDRRVVPGNPSSRKRCTDTNCSNIPRDGAGTGIVCHQLYFRSHHGSADVPGSAFQI